MIRILLSTIPVIGLVLALISLRRFELSEARMLEIRGRLESNRGKV
jgi:Na+/melibiose symporter-like transporter